MNDEVGLIRKLQSGDMAAFEVLFERHRRGLLAYAWGMLRDRQMAEDIVQECFLQLARNADRIEPRRGVSGWLYRVARNRAIDLLRRQQFEIASEMVGEQDQARDEVLSRSPAREMEQAEELAELERVLNALETEDRDILMLRFYGGLRHREIAQTLGRPLGTILWRVHRALRQLRREWERRTSQTHK